MAHKAWVKYMLYICANMPLYLCPSFQLLMFFLKVIPSVDDYATYMREIFDFDQIKKFLQEANFKILVTALNGGKV